MGAFLIDSSHNPVTWYKIKNTGEQVMQWDFQNKGRCIVVEVPLRNLLTSILNFGTMWPGCAKGLLGEAFLISCPCWQIVKSNSKTQVLYQWQSPCYPIFSKKFQFSKPSKSATFSLSTKPFSNLDALPNMSSIISCRCLLVISKLVNMTSISSWTCFVQGTIVAPFNGCWLRCPFEAL